MCVCVFGCGRARQLVVAASNLLSAHNGRAGAPFSATLCPVDPRFCVSAASMYSSSLATVVVFMVRVRAYLSVRGRLCG